MRYIVYLFTCLSLFYASSAFAVTLYKPNGYPDSFGVSSPDEACLKGIADRHNGATPVRHKTAMGVWGLNYVCSYDFAGDSLDPNYYQFSFPIDSFEKQSDCKVGQIDTPINVASMYYDSVCYQGCVYKSTPKGGCISGAGGEGVTCGFTQTASSCDAQDGTYTTGKDSEADKKKKEEAEQKQKELDNTYCKTGTYNAKDPYYTKCPNRDGSGRLKDPSKDGNGNPVSDSSKPSSDGSASTPTSSSSDGSASDPNSNSNNSNSNSDKDDSNNNVDLSPLNATLPTQDLSNSIMSKLNLDMFKTSGSCPSHSYTLTLYSVSKTFNVDYKKFCDVLEILGYIVAVAGCLHAIETVVRDV